MIELWNGTEVVSLPVAGSVNWKSGIRIATKQAAYSDNTIWLCDYKGEFNAGRMIIAIQNKFPRMQVSRISRVTDTECFVEIYNPIGD